jgi:hypothetical protein
MGNYNESFERRHLESPENKGNGLAKVIYGPAGPMYVYPPIHGYFNAGVFRDGKRIGLVARGVVGPAEDGEPDTGPLVHITLDANNRPTAFNTVFEPMREGGKLRLEDPRIAGDKWGVTAVIPSPYGSDGDWTPYPAFLRGGGAIYPDRLHIIKDLGPGKNMTPLGLGDLFFVRSNFDLGGVSEDRRPNSHKLYVIEPSPNGTNIKGVLDLSKSEIEFAKDQGGSAGPPHWGPVRNGVREGLTLFHGFIKSRTSTGSDFYTYGIGAAIIRVFANGEVILTNVIRDPLLRVDDFNQSDGSQMAEQLHPDLRLAEYLVGSAIVNKPNPISGIEQRMAVLFPSVGDTSTFPVEIPLDNLVRHLRAQAVCSANGSNKNNQGVIFKQN